MYAFAWYDNKIIKQFNFIHCINANIINGMIMSSFIYR